MDKFTPGKKKELTVKQEQKEAKLDAEIKRLNDERHAFNEKQRIASKEKAKQQAEKADIEEGR